MHDFSNSFISLKLTIFLFNCASNFTPSKRHMFLYKSGLLSSSNPYTIFLASSTILISSFDVWSERIFWESSCFFSHSLSVSSNTLICSSKWFLRWFINCNLRPFIADISSSKLFYAIFIMFSLFYYTLNRTWRMSKSTFYVLSNFRIPLFLDAYLPWLLNWSWNEYLWLLLRFVRRNGPGGCQTSDMMGRSY